MSLAALTDAVEALVACDVAELSGGEELVALEELSSRLEAVVARAVERFSRDGGYVADGAASAVAWLAARTRRPKREVQAQLHLARLVRVLPVLGEGVLQGEVNTAQLRCVGRRLAARHPEGVGEAEQLLREQSGELPYRAFEQVVAYLAQQLDPDGCEQEALKRRAGRDVWLVASLEGAYQGRIELDPLAGAIVANELDRLARCGYEHDVAEARGRLGRDPVAGELHRTPAQRRADALVEMARRSAGCPDDARRPAPLLSVLVDFPTLSGRVCELSNGMVVTPGSLLAYLDEALVERAVWRGPTRVEVGARTRLFQGATRRAVELRDRQCQHPYCEVPLERCQVDHIVPARDGGPTTQENGRLLCPRHNRLRNSVPDLPDPPRRAGTARPPGGRPPGTAPTGHGVFWRRSASSSSDDHDDDRRRPSGRSGRSGRSGPVRRSVRRRRRGRGRQRRRR